VVLFASGLKLLAVDNVALAWATVVTLLLSVGSWLARDLLVRLFASPSSVEAASAD
jgi:hypothetical protein